jgi:hypothetical protein
MCVIFVVLVSFFPGSDLISRHTGVAAAQTPRRALLIHALGPLRALAIGPDSAAVHSWNWRPLGNNKNEALGSLRQFVSYFLATVGEKEM